jgi:hypothetical protein
MNVAQTLLSVLVMLGTIEKDQEDVSRFTQKRCGLLVIVATLTQVRPPAADEESTQACDRCRDQRD